MFSCHLLRFRPSVYCERGTTSDKGKFRHTGQEALNFSQESIQYKWKKCLHSGNILNISASLYSHKQIGHIKSFLRFFENGNLGYEFITRWSSPITRCMSVLPTSSSSATNIIRGKITLVLKDELAELMEVVLGFRVWVGWRVRRKQMQDASTRVVRNPRAITRA